MLGESDIFGRPLQLTVFLAVIVFIVVALTAAGGDKAGQAKSENERYPSPVHRSLPVVSEPLDTPVTDVLSPRDGANPAGLRWQNYGLEKYSSAMKGGYRKGRRDR